MENRHGAFNGGSNKTRHNEKLKDITNTLNTSSCSSSTNEVGVEHNRLYTIITFGVLAMLINCIGQISISMIGVYLMLTSTVFIVLFLFKKYNKLDNTQYYYGIYTCVCLLYCTVYTIFRWLVEIC